MSSIVIEKLNGAEYAIIITNEEGVNRIFDDLADAEAEAADGQDGVGIEL